jgi:hypothetical protein
MENKILYYTPSIEEFHNGFEFEILDWVENETYRGPQWIKTVYPDFIIGFRTDHLRVEELLKKIRVQYLNEESISSLGFEKSNIFCDSFYLKKEGFFIELKAFFRYNMTSRENLVIIYKCVGDEFLPSRKEQYFKGEIQNKSELSRILKMIDHGK